MDVVVRMWCVQYCCVHTTLVHKLCAQATLVLNAVMSAEGDDVLRHKVVRACNGMLTTTKSCTQIPCVISLRRWGDRVPVSSSSQPGITFACAQTGRSCSCTSWWRGLRRPASGCTARAWRACRRCGAQKCCLNLLRVCGAQLRGALRARMAGVQEVRSGGVGLLH